MALTNHIRRPRRKRPVAWWSVWLIYWAMLIDALIGVVSFAWVATDLSGRLSAWAFLRTFETKETKRDHTRRRRKAHRRL